MNMTLLVAGGLLGVAIAIAHGLIGQARIVEPCEGLKGSQARVLVAVFHLSTLYWALGGLAVIAAVVIGGTESRNTIVAVVIALYVAGAIANFWATRGRHFGWMLLLTASALLAAGVVS